MMGGFNPAMMMPGMSLPSGFPTTLASTSQATRTFKPKPKLKPKPKPRARPHKLPTHSQPPSTVLPLATWPPRAQPKLEPAEATEETTEDSGQPAAKRRHSGGSSDEDEGALALLALANRES